MRIVSPFGFSMAFYIRLFAPLIGEEFLCPTLDRLVPISNEGNGGSNSK